MDSSLFDLRWQFNGHSATSHASCSWLTHERTRSSICDVAKDQRTASQASEQHYIAIREWTKLASWLAIAKLFPFALASYTEESPSAMIPLRSLTYRFNVAEH